MVSYKTNDPKGWCGDPKRGAAMGRCAIHDEPKEYEGKLYLRRVRMNGAYDTNGTYFGVGDPLYWYSNEDGTIDSVTRATSRSLAKRFIRTVYPKVRFFR